jgi:hypothetical protein
VHSGSVIASSISQGHTNVCGINTRSVNCSDISYKWSLCMLLSFKVALQALYNMF